MIAVGRDVVQGPMTLHATGLVYTTLLSLVPLLAFSFSVLKGFGVHNQLEPMLKQFLAPLGDQSQEITVNVIQFVDRVQVGALGALGLALLLYTVISLMQKIEGALNEIWRVQRPRPLGRKFTDFLSVLLLGPMLVFSAIGIAASVRHSPAIEKLSEIPPFGILIGTAGTLMPFVLVAATLTFIYAFIPNTRVRWWAALAGGAIAGALWIIGGWAFARFVASSGSYAAIYSAFASAVLAFIWLYYVWLILLVGAAIAFYVQNPVYATIAGSRIRISNHEKELLALGMCRAVGEAFYRGTGAPDLHTIAQRLSVPTEALEGIVQALEKAGILAHVGEDGGAYLPARPFEQVLVAEPLRIVRHAEEDDRLDRLRLARDPMLERCAGLLERGLEDAFNPMTLRDLAQGPGQAVLEADPTAART
jgi:membrane protein